MIKCEACGVEFPQKDVNTICDICLAGLEPIQTADINEGLERMKVKNGMYDIKVLKEDQAWIRKLAKEAYDKVLADNDYQRKSVLINSIKGQVLRSNDLINAKREQYRRMGLKLIVK